MKFAGTDSHVLWQWVPLWLPEDIVWIFPTSSVFAMLNSNFSFYPFLFQFTFSVFECWKKVIKFAVEICQQYDTISREKILKMLVTCMLYVCTCMARIARSLKCSITNWHTRSIKTRFYSCGGELCNFVSESLENLCLGLKLFHYKFLFTNIETRGQLTHAFIACTSPCDW